MQGNGYLKQLREGTLTSLDLSRDNIGAEGAKALATALKINKTLTYLDLNYNNIRDEGAKAIVLNKTYGKCLLGQSAMNLIDPIKPGKMTYRSLRKAIVSKIPPFLFREGSNSNAKYIAR